MKIKYQMWIQAFVMLDLVNCKLRCNVALKQYLIWNFFSYINLYD